MICLSGTTSTCEVYSDVSHATSTWDTPESASTATNEIVMLLSGVPMNSYVVPSTALIDARAMGPSDSAAATASAAAP